MPPVSELLARATSAIAECEPRAAREASYAGPPAYRVYVIANYADRHAVLGQLAAGALPALSFLEWTDAPTVTRIEQLMRVPCDHLRVIGVASKTTVDLRRAEDATRWELTFELLMRSRCSAISKRCRNAQTSHRSRSRSSATG